MRFESDLKNQGKELMNSMGKVCQFGATKKVICSPAFQVELKPLYSQLRMHERTSVSEMTSL